MSLEHFHKIKTVTYCDKQSILLLWLECWFLDTEVDGLNPVSVCYVLEQDTLSALLQSTQL